MNDITVEVRGLSKVYRSPGEDIEVFSHVNWQASGEKTVAVIGESGVGKSTFLHVLGQLTLPTEGEVFLNGRNLTLLDDNTRARILKNDIAFVFQFFQLFNDLTLRENIYIAARMTYNEKEALERTDAVIEDLGLSHRRSHIVSLLSGGEKQRTAIGRALVKDPVLILADEPTGNLDERHSDEIMDLLLALQKKRNCAFVMVTHNRAMAGRCDEIYQLEHKKLHPLEED
ncbi:MAG TPA: ABC transporter ATP-binding protein [Candidatus Mcinerneyibacteriales bacterium]|nr:ABC transporter ATP-binding protein [Candidatus Mcinerneyibacteriales bacterium]